MCVYSFVFMSASGIFALLDGRKTQPAQFAQSYVQCQDHLNAALAASHSYTCAQDDLVTMKLVLVVFFYQLAQILYLH